MWLGIRMEGTLWTRVGVMGATMVRGDRGGEMGGVVVKVEVEVGDIEGHEAESGLQESLRRQLRKEMSFGTGRAWTGE